MQSIPPENNTITGGVVVVSLLSSSSVRVERSTRRWTASARAYRYARAWGTGQSTLGLWVYPIRASTQSTTLLLYDLPLPLPPPPTIPLHEGRPPPEGSNKGWVWLSRDHGRQVNTTLLLLFPGVVWAPYMPLVGTSVDVPYGNNNC